MDPASQLSRSVPPAVLRGEAVHSHPVVVKISGGEQEIVRDPTTGDVDHVLTAEKMSAPPRGSG